MPGPDAPETASVTGPQYSLRPAKNTERNMLCEALQRLSRFGPLRDYRYVGFGAIYFVDFLLFHRRLGFRTMVSIEQNTEEADRYRLNCPLDCIDLCFGTSHEVLPLLEWDQKTVLWLDYERKLDARKLGDIRTFCTEAPPGSVLLVTLPSQFGVQMGHRIRVLRKHVGEDWRVPDNVKEESLGGSGAAEIYRQIINNEIEDAFLGRKGPTVTYDQLFNFTYSDGTPMLTTGGLLHEASDKGAVSDCRFDELTYYRPGAEAYGIPAPRLTYREICYLNKRLPVDDPGAFEAPPIPETVAQGYAKVYRYFRTFAETEL